MSREHLVTDGLFLDNKIRVKGYEWCPEFKVIGLAGLTKKALCETHNSALSDTDDAAIELFNVLRRAIELTLSRRPLPPHVWTVEQLTANGPKLERWFLKTIITSAFGTKFIIGTESTQPGEPPRTLVEIAFGLKKFQSPAGLYLLSGPGEMWSEDGLRMSTFGGQERNRHLGARFWFRGLDFMLLLDPLQLSGPLTFRSPDGREIIQTQARYHNRVIKFGVHGHDSHTLNFNWD